jgi:hypothetical protein
MLHAVTSSQVLKWPGNETGDGLQLESTGGGVRPSVILKDALSNSGKIYRIAIGSLGELSIRDQGSSTDRFVITTTGNVAIGTSSAPTAFYASTPTNILKWPGSDTGDGLQLEGLGGIQPGVTFKGNLSAKSYRIGMGSDGFAIRDGASSTDRIAIDKAGKVAIGEILGGPATQLQVVGDIRIGDSGTNGCIEDFSGFALVGTCVSDPRLKKNIVPLTSALDKIVGLQPVTFEWRADEFPERRLGGGKKLGLVADEVERALPELVSVDSRGYKEVRYGVELQMLMLQAVKELRAENDALRREVEELRRR